MTVRIARSAVLALAVDGCATGSSNATDSAASAASPTTGASNAAGAPAPDGGWRSLIEQSSAPAWRGYRMDSLPTGWAVADGVLSKQGSVEDLVTRDEFGDFELTLDWKLSPGGNAGVFYRGTE